MLYRTSLSDCPLSCSKLFVFEHKVFFENYLNDTFSSIYVFGTELDRIFAMQHKSYGVMKTKTILLAIVLMASTHALFAQAPEFCEKLDMRDAANAKLELTCADCAAITEVQLFGDGVRFTGIYHGDAWQRKFPKSLELVAGDYTIRYKQNDKNWKTMHFYVPRNKQETLLLN